MLGSLDILDIVALSMIFLIPLSSFLSFVRSKLHFIVVCPFPHHIRPISAEWNLAFPVAAAGGVQGSKGRMVDDQGEGTPENAFVIPYFGLIRHRRHPLPFLGADPLRLVDLAR